MADVKKMQFDHEMTVSEYLEAAKPNCEINMTMTWEIPGVDEEGNRVKVFMAKRIKSRGTMTFEGDAIVFKSEKEE